MSKQDNFYKLTPKLCEELERLDQELIDLIRLAMECPKKEGCEEANCNLFLQQLIHMREILWESYRDISGDLVY